MKVGTAAALTLLTGLNNRIFCRKMNAKYQWLGTAQ